MHIPVLIIDCILIAFSAGLVYGIFGSGSGIVMVPGYYYVLKHFEPAQDHRMQMAIATTAAASAILGYFSSRVQVKANNVDYSTVKKIFPGITVGTILAVLLLNVAPSHILKYVFAIAVLLVALWLGLYDQAKDKKHWSLNNKINHGRTTIIGLLWFSLGIAVFTVPYLHKAGISIKRAIGCASFVGAIFSALAAILFIITGYFVINASWSHAGYVNLLLLVFSIIPSSIAGHLGSKFSHKLPPHIMKKIYAFLICLVGILMLL